MAFCFMVVLLWRLGVERGSIALKQRSYLLLRVMTPGSERLPEAILFKLRGPGDLVQSCVEVGLGLGGRDVADGLQQAPVIEPVHPIKSGEFNLFE